VSHFLLNILLALTWTALTGVFTPANFLLGFGLGFLALQVARRPLGKTGYFSTLPRLASFVLFFLGELIIANLQVAAAVLTPRWHMRPRVLAVPLEAATDVEITLLANLVSLTPGWLSLDVSSDRRVLYIHAMFAEDPEQVRRQVKEGFERRLLRITRGMQRENER
jgi:multicomponent Na+:H+ antiporter subunit E